MSGETIERQVQHLLISKGWTLSVAESCTGGAVSALLTAVPGASRYYLGGIIAYSNELKMKMLGVSATLLQEKGAVDTAIVEAMVGGLLSLVGSDFALAVSGIAGPEGGSAAKPVGTVWCAVGRKGEVPYSWQLQLNGSRAEIIETSAFAVLEGLLSYAQRVSSPS